MKSITTFINESIKDEYTSIRKKLGRFGFVPRGRTVDEWDFMFYDRSSNMNELYGIYTISVFVDKDGVPFEFTLMCECGANGSDFDETFNSLEDMLDKFKVLKKENRK